MSVEMALHKFPLLCAFQLALQVLLTIINCERSSEERN